MCLLRRIASSVKSFGLRGRVKQSKHVIHMKISIRQGRRPGGGTPLDPDESG